MATWRKKELPLTPNQTYSEGCLLLSDGRLLVVCKNGSYTITPDEWGDYYNGTLSSFSFFPIQNQTSYGGSLAIMPDGTVVKWGSHEQYDAPNHGRIIVYNPETNVWTNSSVNDARVAHSCGSIVRLKDGRIGKVNGNSFIEYNHITNQITYTPMTETAALINWNSGFGQSASGVYTSEGGWAQLADDSYVMFCPTAVAIWPVTANDVFEHYVITPDGLLDIDIHPKPTTYKTAKNYTGYMATGKNSNSVNPYVLDVATSGYSSDRTPSINHLQMLGAYNNQAFELPANIWVPKFQRVLALGGGCGELFSYNPATHTTEIIAQAPQTTRSGQPFSNEFVLVSSNVGLTISQLLNLTKIEVQVAPGSVANQPPPILYLEMTNDALLSISPASLTRDGGLSVTQIPPGSTLEYNSPYRQIFGPRPDVDTVAVTTGRVFSSPPVRISSESNAIVLPNGNYMVMSAFGQYSIGGTVSGQWLEWDGSQFILHDDSFLDSGGSSWDCWTFILPTGELMGAYADGGIWFRSETMTQYEPQRPIIDSLPSAVRPGRTFTLAGRQLWGIHVGVIHGDDFQLNCNNPVVQLKNISDGRIYYAKIKTYGSSSIKPNFASQMEVEIPLSTPIGSYELRVISAGNPSLPSRIQISNSGVASGSSGMFNPFLRSV